jgi:hypothetical protein
VRLRLFFAILIVAVLVLAAVGAVRGLLTGKENTR